MVNTGDRLYLWTALPESKAYLAEVQRLRESAPHVYTFDKTVPRPPVEYPPSPDCDPELKARILQEWAKTQTVPAT